MLTWSIETHTRLIAGVKQAQIRLNLLIGLRRITVKSIFYSKVDKMITAIIRSVFLKSERFLLYIICQETQHCALVHLCIVSGVEKMTVSLFWGKFENGHFWPELTQVWTFLAWSADFSTFFFNLKKVFLGDKIHF